MLGTLNIGRMGDDEAHYTPERVRADEAVRGPGGDRAAERRGARGGQGPGRARRADRPAEPRRVPARAGEAIAAATGRPVALLMMDLDAFKAFNDAHGHPSGDALLARCASAIDGALRDGDRAYRYGGDEFAVILPGLDQTQAQQVAERIRAAVARTAADEVGDAGPLVTISVGIACLPRRRTIEGRPGQGGRRPALPRQAVASGHRPEAGRPRGRLSGRPQRDGGRPDEPARPDRAAGDDRPARGGSGRERRTATCTSSIRSRTSS